MRILIFLCACFYWATASSLEMVPSNSSSIHKFYVGADAGYGSTTWEGLVPTPDNLNLGMKVSTPLMVSEGGVLWGVFAGYEFSPHFALEANYMHYPKATISFDEESIFAFENEGLVDLHTDTDTISFMAKVMLSIPRTRVRGYSSFGIAEIHRQDNINDTRRVTPTFGLGFIYDISEHIMAELGFNYTAGYGEAELNPALDYVPFLYAGIFKLAYRL